MIIDHIGFSVSDFIVSNEFYCKTLAPLGIERIVEVEGASGFGMNGKPEFWLGKGNLSPSPMHVAFVAGSRKEVEQFYEAALACGGKDNGAPGIRERYHPNYYGAFVIDPDGHNIEAVCHQPE
ncbi:glyoxalase/bleomycin resistance/extradiol dioxygenase family protein [Shewanella sp. Choline-02u-19]|uniref:VOC family protein n=1 Tax=unclassified Shewanella TaxID=196818 RepID=UPI000C32C11C|nr:MULTISPECIES: VOC family protein [unclassified Shewanella]PKH62579.1 glyoxalase/bleomycin resistance/extradiol dioxygenase family protein [Shewanella sp. Bg11-22]PKI27910.1 glyoxalase/bleomycin resistance/extradiol dioxygenase family protein [Shewanella sp. Choline-02u-19]